MINWRRNDVDDRRVTEKRRSCVDPTWAVTKDNDVKVHLIKWMPLQNTTDLMYITNRCPQLFVLCVLNCTVSKLHSGVSPSSPLPPLKSYYCFRLLHRKMKKKIKDVHKKTNTGTQRQSAHKECWVGLMKINDLPTPPPSRPIIYLK